MPSGVGRRQNRYVCQDARRLSALVSPRSVQATVTSPPYFDVKDYGKQPLQIGVNQEYSDYLSDLKSVFTQCWEATQDSGSLWLVVDTYKRDGRLKLLPFDLVHLLEKIGWIPQDVVVWDKVKNLPYSGRGRFRNNFEYVLLFSKTGSFKFHVDRIREVNTLGRWWVKYPERYNPKGKVPDNIWRMPIPVQGSWGNGAIQHVCPFPPQLVERMLLLSTDEDDLVLDPFAGSGVVLGQAKCMKRRFVGCDTHAEYIKSFYSTLLPDLQRNWVARDKELAQQQALQEELSKTIIRLRKLKYGQLLLRKLAVRFGRIAVSLAVLGSPKGGASEIEFTLVLALSDSVHESGVIDWIAQQKGKKPFSSFGVNPTVKVTSIAGLSAELPATEYCLYLDGKFYEKAADASLTSVLQSSYPAFPPMVSDIDVARRSMESAGLPYP